MNNKKIIFLGIILAIAFAIPMALLNGNNNSSISDLPTKQTIDTVYDQQVTNITALPHSIFAFYDKGRLVGYLSDEDVLNDLFDQVYKERFIESFPGAKVGLGADVYLLRQSSYNSYENIDEKIINYINDNELFAIEATKITFSNGTVCYVKNVIDFDSARESYLLNFIAIEDYQRIKMKIEAPILVGIGKQTVDLIVNQTVTTTKGFASPSRILKNEDEIITFLGYGNTPNKVNYTVARYDTVEGIAFRNGISVGNLMTINKDVISSTEQLLNVGMQVNVARFNSPIQIIVQEESIEEEAINPPEPQIIVDASYPIDYREIIIQAKPGKQLSRYLNTFVNGTNYESKFVDKYIIEEPTRMVIRLGSFNVDTTDGMFGWPVSRRRITCGWLCYSGHMALDFQPNGFNSYDWPILASADGYVSTNMYQSSLGYYVDIKHVGGYMTRYAHQIRKAPVKVGQAVSRGQVIGNIGNTGDSTGAHLHFEIRLSGKRLNPCLFLGCPIK